MLPRTLETEAMSSLEEAVDYDAMDHGEVNRLFASDLLATGPGNGEMLDLGTGTAQIPIELCRQSPAVRVLAVDLSANMIEVARRNVQAAGLTDQIRLELVDAKRLPYGDGSFATVMSNSIVHHIADPRPLFDDVWRITAAGGLVFFRDLLRPDDEDTLRRLVETYAVGATPHQRQMFEDSLLAAFTIDEMRRMVAPLGQPPESVLATSDRHWTWVGRKAALPWLD
jgi:ubiquinone/menaquinone biosynthesis C-methylase UbiE